MSQETFSTLYEELPQNLAPPLVKQLPQKSTPHLEVQVAQDPPPYLIEEQQPLSMTVTTSSLLLEKQPSDDEYGNLNSNRKRSLKGFGNSKKWDKSITKIKRMKGEEYVEYRKDKKVLGNEKFKVIHDIPRPAREMGPRCTSTFCTKSKVRGCSSLTEDERQNIFSKFWKDMSWDQKKQYVVSHVLICQKKQVKIQQILKGVIANNTF
ncbi:unnamed protein product [Parnassius apollo]|uniref:(apollo) hypothetical protein n=1 Tax=Parnassius apollo TaxID=110799 RepID=A0A8S3WP95_PARAO|nr:unnamed protein product [Parnassius apollo]